jgi:hypothetical protein
MIAPVLEDFAEMSEHNLPLLAFFLVLVVAHVMQDLLEFLGSGGVFRERQGRVYDIALRGFIRSCRDIRGEHFIV